MTDSLNCNTIAPLAGTAYQLQPGDGTRYVFTVSPLSDEHSAVISGIGHQSDYFLLTILAPETGTAVLGRASAAQVCTGFLSPVGYAKSHGMAQVSNYTLIACMLAAGCLLVNPVDLDGACTAMLQAGDLTSRMRREG